MKKTYSIKFTFYPPAGGSAGADIIETMSENGHSLNSWWTLGDLPEDSVYDLLGQAQSAFEKKNKRKPSDRFVFPDGSELDDWSHAQINVERISVDPLGLMGPDETIYLTLKFTPESRWKR